MENADYPSDVAEFYKNRTILVTGGTGFMGKVLIEKLLRSCSGIKRIYLLVRWKKGIEPQERLHQLFDSKLFGRLKKEQPNFSEKVVCISGNLEFENLGIPDDEYVNLVEVSVIFHVAADVRFNKNIKNIVNLNVGGTKRVIDLARKLKELTAFVYVSSAYSNTHQRDIYERVYSTEFPAKDVIDCLSWMSDEMAETINPKLLSRHPNNYCYTKCLSEQLLAEEAGSLPVVIVRPVIVGSTYKEPIEGWIDCFNANSLGYVQICKGLGRVMYRTTKMPEFVPVDLCINLIVASAWDIYRNTDSDKLVVYNYSISTRNKFYTKEREEYFWKLPELYPSVRAYRYPHVTFADNALSYEINNFLSHILPAVLFDIYLFVIAKKPRMVSRYRKFRSLEKSVRYFYTQEWKFHTNNVDRLFDGMSDVDKQIFEFDVRNIDWNKYIDAFGQNSREYLLKEDPSTLPLAKKRINRLYYGEMAIRVVVLGAIVCLLPNDVWCGVAGWYQSISSAARYLVTW